jgi:ubiquinone/menaquinone biosynthesis C-methylase UbiE
MGKLLDILPFRKTHVCPWWLCFTFDNIFRRFFQNPYNILAPHLHEGDTALDVGPGMGYFTIPMAKRVGASGRVIAVDIQQEMLSRLKRRAVRAGLGERIFLQLCTQERLGVDTRGDFILAFWMVHEVTDRERFTAELGSLLKDRGTLLIAEPVLHVSKLDFEETVRLAVRSGLTVRGRPKVFLSRCALFARGSD